MDRIAGLGLFALSSYQKESEIIHMMRGRGGFAQLCSNLDSQAVNLHEQTTWTHNERRQCFCRNTHNCCKSIFVMCGKVN